MTGHLECICGECKGNDRRHFVCTRCYRITPWCRGTDAKDVDLCDECAAEAAQGLDELCELGDWQRAMERWEEE